MFTYFTTSALKRGPGMILTYGKSKNSGKSGTGIRAHPVWVPARSANKQKIRRFLSKNIPACLSLSSIFYVARQLHSPLCACRAALKMNGGYSSIWPTQFGIFFSANRLIRNGLPCGILLRPAVSIPKIFTSLFLIRSPVNIAPLLRCPKLPHPDPFGEGDH